jgi:hypothetical protein
MKVNINHPSFITFLDNVNNSVLFNVSVENYFELSGDSKLALQYKVFLLMKNSVSLRAKLENDELRSFLTVMWKKNEENENYEFASVLNDILINFDSICEVTKPKRKTNKTTKIDNSTKNG